MPAFRHDSAPVSPAARGSLPIVAPVGWIETVGGLRKTRHRGTDRVGWMFTLSAAAYNLIRMPKLLAAAP